LAPTVERRAALNRQGLVRRSLRQREISDTADSKAAHSRRLDLRVKLGRMTETPEYTTTPGDTSGTGHETLVAPARATEPVGRWRRFAGRPRLYRVAAAVGTLAATVVVIAAIFWSGFVMGAHAGGHHGHGGGSTHESAMMHHGHGGGEGGDGGGQRGEGT
jgi:hypothetical protein